MARKDRGATRQSHLAHGVTLHGSLMIHGAILRSVGAGRLLRLRASASQ